MAWKTNEKAVEILNVTITCIVFAVAFCFVGDSGAATVNYRMTDWLTDWMDERGPSWESIRCRWLCWKSGWMYIYSL
jgi:hypothetical protein